MRAVLYLLSSHTRQCFCGREPARLFEGDRWLLARLSQVRGLSRGRHWGVKRNEDAPEDIGGRRWHLKGNRLVLTYPGDHGLETAVFTIVSLTDHKMSLTPAAPKKN